MSETLKLELYNKDIPHTEDRLKDYADYFNWQDTSELALALKSARADFLKSRIRVCVKKEYELGLIFTELSAAEERINVAHRAIINPKKTMFITINPSPSVELADFVKIVHKYADRSMFSKVLYCFEQRGTLEKDIGKGFHCHLLVHRNGSYPPNKVKKNTYNTFKKVVGSEASIDYGKGLNNIKNRQNYIVGTKKNKKDDDKKSKQDADVVWRQTYDLDSYYGELFSPI